MFVSNKKNTEVLQPKLKIGGPGDKYEREADRVADAVMRMPDSGGFMQPKRKEQTPLIKMKCKRCKEEDKLQMKPIVQNKDSGQSHASPEIARQINASKGQGDLLPTDIRQEMSYKMGTDFSDVNIHTDTRAKWMNQQLGARAFTVGNDIYFNSNQYAPKSSGGKRLLAHELTHTVQQNGNEVLQRFELPDWARSLVRGGEVAFRLTLHDEGSKYAKALMRHYLLGGGETFNPEESAVNFPTDSMWSTFMAGRPEIQRSMLGHFRDLAVEKHRSGESSGTFSMNVTDVRLNELESMRWTLHGAHRIEVAGDFRITDTELVFSRGAMAPTTRRTNPRVTFSNIRMVWVDVGDMHPGTITETDTGETIDDAEFTAAGNSYPIRIPFYIPGESVWEVRGRTATKLNGWPNPSQATSTNYRG